MTEEGGVDHVAVPVMVGGAAAFAVHSSMPPAVSLALTENSLPSNQGCRPRETNFFGGVPPESFAASSMMKAACRGPWKINPG